MTVIVHSVNVAYMWSHVLSWYWITDAFIDLSRNMIIKCTYLLPHKEKLDIKSITSIFNGPSDASSSQRETKNSHITVLTIFELDVELVTHG
jgi:hypothetical protein